MKKNAGSLSEITINDLIIDPATDRRIKQFASSAVHAGSDSRKLAKLLRDFLSDKFQADKIINIKGKQFDLGKYSKLLAGYRLREAQTNRTIESCDEWGNDLVKISSHINPCSICAQYDGKTYSLHGKTQGHEILPAKPPFCLECGHSLSATSIEAIEWDKEHQKL